MLPFKFRHAMISRVARALAGSSLLVGGLRALAVAEAAPLRLTPAPRTCISVAATGVERHPSPLRAEDDAAEAGHLGLMARPTLREDVRAGPCVVQTVDIGIRDGKPGSGFEAGGLREKDPVLVD